MPDQKMTQRSDWYLVSGAALLKQQSALSYADYLARSSNHATPELEDDLRQIELDLPRTGLSICQFLLHQPVPNDDDDLPTHLFGPFQEKLRKILTAYSVRNPRVGYVQGHCDIVCFLLGNINTQEQDEEEASFWVYVSIIERVFPSDFFARSPKLHGLHVDNKLYAELISRKILPHLPLLAQADVSFVTSLLSCKWFVSIWVGLLPERVLYKVWDTMLREDSGSILHLVLALHYFHVAAERVQAQEHDYWDASSAYKQILEQSQVNEDVDPSELLSHAQSLYGLNDEAVEDLRSAIRRHPQIRQQEIAILQRQTRFNANELERMLDEFTFVRFQSKNCERTKLRGLRREYFESILAREYPPWPLGVYGQLFRLLRPDGYGNISFSSLVQLLSVLSRGTVEEKARLLFRIPDSLDHGYLDQNGVHQLADLACCLLVSKTVNDTQASLGDPLEREPPPDPTLGQHSSLMREHFRRKLIPLVREDTGQLVWDDWLVFMESEDPEVELVVEWTRSHGIASGLRRKMRRKKSQNRLQQTNPTSPEHLQKAQSLLNGVSPVSTSGKTTPSSSSSRRKAHGRSALSPSKPSDRRPVSLLSKQLRKKFKASQSILDSDEFSRNPFESSLGGGSVPNGVFWCECVIS